MLKANNLCVTLGGKPAYQTANLMHNDPFVAKRLLTAVNLTGKYLEVQIYLAGTDADGEIWLQLDDSGASITDWNGMMRAFRIPTANMVQGWNTVTLAANVASTSAAAGQIGYAVYTGSNNNMMQAMQDNAGTNGSGRLRIDNEFDVTKVSTFGFRSHKMGVDYAVGTVEVVNAKSSGGSGSGSVETGDVSNIALVLGVLMLACAAAATATFCGKKAMSK